MVVPMSVLLWSGFGLVLVRPFPTPVGMNALHASLTGLVRETGLLVLGMRVSTSAP